ncbi:MAG: DUF3995 domain-containing protein [Deltaproteobacteria bacterium]|nr:DUF3995 domain-containing protein [Deltaproteobacteria bacterium]
MNIALGLAGTLWLFTAGLHAVAGGREVLRPVLVAPLDPLARGVSEVAWHLLTWQFAGFGVAGLITSTLPSAQPAYAWLSGASAVGFASLFLGFGALRFRSILRMPQWILFVPIAGLSLARELHQRLTLGAVGHVAGIGAAGILLGLSALHVAWARGSTYPAKSHTELARLVVGEGLGDTAMPRALATWAVAIALALSAAGLLALGASGTPPTLTPTLRLAAALMALVFALRGVGGFFEVHVRPAIRGTPYMRWSRLLYSPIALGLALLIGLRAGL